MGYSMYVVDRRDYDDCLYYYSKVRAIPATAAAATI